MPKKSLCILYLSIQKNIREEHLKDYRDIEITHYIPIEAFRKEMPFYDYQIIVDYSTLNLVDMIPNQDSIIFNIEEKQMNQFARAIQILLEKSDRINVNFLDLTEKFDYEIYERQLEKCNERLKEIYLQTGKLKEINVITDILFIKKHEGCPAGNTSIALAPDGRFYICPAFYSQKMQSIGNIENGVEIKNQELYTPQYMPLCNMCDAYQCENCKYLNYMNTNEINVSPSFQCKKAIVEKKAAESLCLVLKDSISFLNIPKNNGDVDPINVLLNNNRNRGYY
ncbi:MAG: CXXX repeat peptide maturase [Blautia wexlerae]